MNLYENIKSNLEKKQIKRTHLMESSKKSIKETSEEIDNFWAKVDNGEIKVGDKIQTSGAGKVDLLDLDKNADYIIVKRNTDFQPFVAAWAPALYNDGVTWGQGHYFDTEEEAKEYFNKKKLGESVKDKKKKSSLKESIEECVRYYINADYDELEDEAFGDWDAFNLLLKVVEKYPDKSKKAQKFINIVRETEKEEPDENPFEILDYSTYDILELANEIIPSSKNESASLKESGQYTVPLKGINRNDIEQYFGTGNSKSLADETYLALLIYNGQYFFMKNMDWSSPVLVADFKDMCFYKIDSSTGKGLPMDEKDINFIQTNFYNNTSTNESCEKKKSSPMVKEEESTASNFPRTILLDRVGYEGEKTKYRFVQEYNGFGIYQERTPSGYAVHQSYMITNGKDKPLESESYNHNDLEDMLDIIDVYNSTGHYGQKTMDKGDHLILDESCGKKKRPSLKESNPARYLGVKQNLTEKVNHANDEINAKIREALRSKTAARKYADEFKNLGITIDDDQREGVTLVGPNGRRLSADRLEIQGPTKPGHNNTHYRNIKSYKNDIEHYKNSIADKEKDIEDLNNLKRDDIIRKYPDKSTEEAMDAHKENIEKQKRYRDNYKRYLKDTFKSIEQVHDDRQLGHNSGIYYNDNKISRQSSTADKVDYKGYLDSKDNSDNKDYYGGGWRNYRKETKGQEARQAFKNLKRDVNNTVSSWQADEIITNRKINDETKKKRKAELEDEYKQKVADEMKKLDTQNKMANENYNRYKDTYKNNVDALNKFRKENKLKTQPAKSFDTYLKGKQKDRY